MFPDETAARAWFKAESWPDGRYCPRCGSTDTHECAHTKCPYRCRDCRKYFSVKTGSAMVGSPIPLRLWAIALYLEVTRPKGVSGAQLAKDIGVIQKTAWFLLHRIREAWVEDQAAPMPGPVEADETHVGGLFKNMHAKTRRARRKEPNRGKTIVAGVRDRNTRRVHARVVAQADRATLQGFVRQHVEPGARLYTDEAAACKGTPGVVHESVNHSAGEYVRGKAHTNGMESIWSLFKRAYHGTFHQVSPKHLQRYVNEFAGRQGLRDEATIEQMKAVACGMIGRRLMYRDLIAG